jgi:hypothetical protein
MFHHLLTELTPTSLDTLILDVIELGPLEMRPQETPKAFLARARQLMNSLENVKIPQIIPLLVLCRLDREMFPRIRRSLENGDSSLISADMDGVEQRVLCDHSFHLSFGDGPPAPNTSARRANNNRSNQSQPTPTQQASFPPHPPPTYAAIKKYLEEHPNTCTGCWHEVSDAHLTKGCPLCAAQGRVRKKDPVKAGRILTEYRAGRGGRGG